MRGREDGAAALTAPGVETPAHEDGPNEGDGGAATAPGIETPAHEDDPNEDGEDGPNEGGAHEGEG